MTLSEMLRAKQEADKRALDAILNVRAEDFTPENEARAAELTTQMRERAERITEAVEAEARQTTADAAAVQHGEADTAEQRTEPPAVVTREQRTYTEQRSLRGEASFFRDAFVMRSGDYNARERIERHMREVAIEGEATEDRAAGTTDSFAGLVVPQYLVDQAALLARAGRPFANACQHLQLPGQGMTFEIPKGTTGASAGVQAAQNVDVSNTTQVWANVTVPVATIAGQQDVSRQALERGTPGIDALIYMDLVGAHAVALDGQALDGSGASGQMLGVLNTSGIGTSTAFGAAATSALLWKKFAGAVNTVETTRFLPPTFSVMHPRRWNWLVSQVDGSQRPLVVPNQSGPMNTYGVYDGPEYGTVAGTFQALPVITDANMPTNVGTENEDQVLVARAADLLLWEDGDGMPRRLRFEETAGGQLTVKLVIYSYAAFSAGRYPAAVATVGGVDTVAGDGLIAPTF